ncbi:hypothetical protein AVEN_136880-1 [Araneus ventricosus]|uniref:Uncharacterized protein n=1 Tax=Araneus ventricosus TaxID=182803 RepID=A0A4Y2W773_ARAVE|nr:hypothetical protein AVEN_136880-1 [Araneus ventricosus]
MPKLEVTSIPAPSTRGDGPGWSSGKVSRFETRFHRRTAVCVSLAYVKYDVIGQTSSRCCGSEWRMSAQVYFSSSDRGLTLCGQVTFQNTRIRWFSHHIPFIINDVLISIISGVVGTADVNCHLSHDLGCEGISRIVGGNFGNVKFKRKNKVITLASVKNSAKIGREKITVDPLTLFHRICVAKQSDEDLKVFFIFELSPFPLSLFNEEGMRKGTKSSLFSLLTSTKIDAVQGKINFVVVNGGHLLHKVVWQRNMNFGDIAKSYLIYLQTHYGSNVAVVFDGYPSYVTGKSTKSAERIRRANLIHHMR